MRRGQVALEFITTYGWALLMMLAMIGAISYFGVLRPDSVLPSRCTTGSEFSCSDFQIDGESDTLNLVLQQGIGKTIFPQAFSCNFNGVESTSGTWSEGATWSPKATNMFSCEFPGNTLSALRGEKIKIDFEVTYKRSPSGFDHLVEGELFTEVQ